MSTDRDLASLLLDAEQRAGAIPALEQRIADLEDAVRDGHDLADQARREADEERERLAQVTRELIEVKTSVGWRLERRLRAASGRTD